MLLDQVYFDPESGSGTGSVFWINDDDLLTTIRRLDDVDVDVDESVVDVAVYRHPLYFWQVQNEFKVCRNSKAL